MFVSEYYFAAEGWVTEPKAKRLVRDLIRRNKAHAETESFLQRAHHDLTDMRQEVFNVYLDRFQSNAYEEETIAFMQCLMRRRVYHDDMDVITIDSEEEETLRCRPEGSSPDIESRGSDRQTRARRMRHRNMDVRVRLFDL